MKSPLRIAKIVGDINGVSEIAAMNESKVSTTIPKELQLVTQLQEYFDGKRFNFDF